MMARRGAHGDSIVIQMAGGFLLVRPGMTKPGTLALFRESPWGRSSFLTPAKAWMAHSNRECPQAAMAGMPMPDLWSMAAASPTTPPMSGAPAPNFSGG